MNPGMGGTFRISVYNADSNSMDFKDLQSRHLIGFASIDFDGIGEDGGERHRKIMKRLPSGEEERRVG